MFSLIEVLSKYFARPANKVLGVKIRYSPSHLVGMLLRHHHLQLQPVPARRSSAAPALDDHRNL